MDLRTAPPGSADFAAAVLGPTGNLRAQTARAGKVWLVGFNEAAWVDALG